MSAPFMQLYVADYLGDTQHLSTEENGAYLLLLMNMWRHGGKLPADEKTLSRIARVSPRRWHLVAPAVMPFFDVIDGKLTQKRLVEEYQKAISKSEKRSVSGKAGGDAKALKDKELVLANAKQMPQHSSEPEPYRTSPLSEALPATAKKRASRVDGFEPDLAVAVEMGLSPERARLQVAKFQDFWRGKPGKDGTKADWPATWRNWIRSEIERNGAGGGPAHRSQPPPARQRSPNAPSSAHGLRALQELADDLERKHRNEPSRTVDREDGAKVLGFEPRFQRL